jgi:hypothetical protein
MASKRPRTTLLLTDELMTAIRSLSDASGMTMSSIVVQFLEPSIPVMKQLEQVVLEAKRGLLVTVGLLLVLFLRVPIKLLPSLTGNLES